MIDIRGIEKTYRRGTETVVACRIEALSIEPGDQVAFVGPSGCGKTTLLHIISGLLKPDCGSVRIAGKELFGMSEAGRDRFRAENIGYVHQTFNLLAPFNAVENVMLAEMFAGAKSQRARAVELLETVGLADRIHHRPAELSVGQQQRVAVARALVNRPTLLLADEPTGNQDPETGRQTLELMLDLAADFGTTVLMVTHDPNVAALMKQTIELPSLDGSDREAVSCG